MTLGSSETRTREAMRAGFRATRGCSGSASRPVASTGDETVNAVNLRRAFPDMLPLIPFGLIVYCGNPASPRLQLWDRLPSLASLASARSAAARTACCTNAPRPASPFRTLTDARRSHWASRWGRGALRVGRRRGRSVSMRRRVGGAGDDRPIGGGDGDGARRGGEPRLEVKSEALNGQRAKFLPGLLLCGARGGKALVCRRSAAQRRELSLAELKGLRQKPSRESDQVSGLQKRSESLPAPSCFPRRSIFRAGCGTLALLRLLAAPHPTAPPPPRFGQRGKQERRPAAPDAQLGAEPVRGRMHKGRRGVQLG